VKKNNPGKWQNLVGGKDQKKSMKKPNMLQGGGVSNGFDITSMTKVNTVAMGRSKKRGFGAETGREKKKKQEGREKKRMGEGKGRKKRPAELDRSSPGGYNIIQTKKNNKKGGKRLAGQKNEENVKRGSVVWKGGKTRNNKKQCMS